MGSFQESLGTMKLSDKEDFHRAAGLAHTEVQDTPIQKAERKHGVFART